MTTILLSNENDLYSFSISRGRIRTRLRAWLASLELDSQLARGLSPDTSAPLSLRAQRLQGPSHRRRLARGLRRALSAALADPRPIDRRVPLARDQIRDCAGLIEELAGRLDAQQPADPRGIARAELLLSAGNSPLYRGAISGTLGSALRLAIEGLTPPPEILAIA
jgi:hypothetical protein